MMLFFILCIVLSFQAAVLAQTPPGFSPPSSHRLHVQYAGGLSVSPGDSLRASDASSIPTISMDDLSSLNTYIVFLIDVDVILEHKATTVLHWYQPNMVVSSPTRALINKTDDGAVYIGPRPPPGSNHRYVFLLFEQPDGYVLPECYSYILPVTVEARAGFDIEHFMQVTKLRQPVAGNYFFVEGDGDVTTTLTATTTSVLSPVCSNGGTRNGYAYKRLYDEWQKRILKTFH